MRVWSIHPSYLDTVGLTACWRETLLARKVLAGNTKGYKNHPQLIRFREYDHTMQAVEAYLYTIWQEATARGYKYDSTKAQPGMIDPLMTVTNGQLQYEFDHLKQKLLSRSPLKYQKIESVNEILPNPIFRVVDGGIEDWEVIR